MNGQLILLSLNMLLFLYILISYWYVNTEYLVFQFEWLPESSDMTRSQGIGLAIFIFYTLAATITIVTVILLTSKTESNDDTFSPNETMTISKDDNEISTNISVPVVTIPHNWAKEDSDINNNFTDRLN